MRDSSDVPASAARYLLPYEVLVAGVRQHPILLVPGYVTAAGGLAAAWFASAWVSAGWILVPVWVAAGFLVARSLFLTANWSVQYVVITKTRVVLKSGLFNPRVISIPMQSLQNPTYDRSFGGSTFGYGTLGNGETGEVIIDYLAMSEQIYREIKYAADPNRPSDPDDDI